MTDRPTRGENDRPTVQLLVHGDGDRAALAELLDDRYDVVVGDAVQPADCHIVGDRTIPAHRDGLRALKREANPRFTPVLLLRREGSNATVPLPAEQSDDGPPLVDEVVAAPVDRTTLLRRVENLLARREQSLELARRYEDVKTRFRRLFDSTNDALLVVTPDGDEATECNPAACDLLGYTREVMLSMSPAEALYAEDRERFRSFLEEVREAGQGSTDDLTCQTRGGETRRLEVSAATLTDAEGASVILSMRDVTERRAYERELELKSRAMDEAPVGITITDPDREDNPMVYVNDGFQAMTGYSAEESIGRNCRFLQGEATRDQPVARMREAVDAAEPVSVELRNYRKDGSRFWNRVSIAPVRDDDGTVTNWVGFQEDVTERKERERDLQLFRKAVENAGHAVFITDRDGTIEYTNPVFESQSGYAREEAVGQTPAILNSGKHDDKFYERMWQTIRAGREWNARLINRHKNGELYHVDQTISPITNDAGEITHFVTIEADVTSRRLREQQLDVLNRVLRHNLRNGTNVIQGQAALLRESVDDDLQANAAAIEERAEALVTLGEKANNVRSLFEDGSPAEGTCDVTELLADLVEEFSEAYPAASIILDETDPVPVQADDRLRMALRELLDNAVVHNDGQVPAATVSVRTAERGGSEGWVEIEVADDGPGIPDYERKTIQNGTESSLQHGSGLGLWIAHWTASLFGGEVSIEDNSPRGARVVLGLPPASGDASAPTDPVGTY